jgi:hypothetical protein
VRRRKAQPSGVPARLADRLLGDPSTLTDVAEVTSTLVRALIAEHGPAVPSALTRGLDGVDRVDEFANGRPMSAHLAVRVAAALTLTRDDALEWLGDAPSLSEAMIDASRGLNNGAVPPDGARGLFEPVDHGAEQWDRFNFVDMSTFRRLGDVTAPHLVDRLMESGEVGGLIRSWLRYWLSNYWFIPEPPRERPAATVLLAEPFSSIGGASVLRGIAAKPTHERRFVIGPDATFDDLRQYLAATRSGNTDAFWLPNTLDVEMGSDAPMTGDRLFDLARGPRPPIDDVDSFFSPEIVDGAATKVTGSVAGDEVLLQVQSAGGALSRVGGGVRVLVAENLSEAEVDRERKWGERSPFTADLPRSLDGKIWPVTGFGVFTTDA